MAALRDRPWQGLSTFELLIRYEAYQQRFRVEEHRALRDGLEKAVVREPNDANAWATLAMLRFHEHAMMGHDTRATPLERAWEAAERAIEIDSTCIRGWLVLTLMRGRARDLPGLRAASQRVLEINPLDTSKLAVVAFMLTCAGDIERGEELARRAMSLHSNTAGWYRMPAFYRPFFAGEYPEALQAARLIGIDSLPLTSPSPLRPDRPAPLRTHAARSRPCSGSTPHGCPSSACARTTRTVSGTRTPSTDWSRASRRRWFSRGPSPKVTSTRPHLARHPDPHRADPRRRASVPDNQHPRWIATTSSRSIH